MAEKKKRYVNLSGTINMKSNMKQEPRSLKSVADVFAERLFGIPLSKAHADSICIDCRLDIDMDGWDELSKAEYEISGLCQECQDKLFKDCE